MDKKISRRSFIKGGLAAIGVVGANALPLPPVVRAAGQEEPATLVFLCTKSG